MKASGWIRRGHRWVAIAFVLTVAANFVALVRGAGAPPAWITYAPLAPLAVLTVTGLYMFVLPYVGGREAKRRGPWPSSERERTPVA